MRKATMVHSIPDSLPMTYRDPRVHRRPRLTYSCTFQYQAWVHVIRLGERTSDPNIMRDVRNVLCRALLELDVDVWDAKAEADEAVRDRNTALLINGVKYRSTGVTGERFRAAAVDIHKTRVVVVVPTVQEEIAIRLPGLRTGPRAPAKKAEGLT